MGEENCSQRCHLSVANARRIRQEHPEVIVSLRACVLCHIPAMLSRGIFWPSVQRSDGPERHIGSGVCDDEGHYATAIGACQGIDFFCGNKQR